MQFSPVAYYKIDAGADRCDAACSRDMPVVIGYFTFFMDSFAQLQQPHSPQCSSVYSL
jgi:hypothetical protein